MKQRLSLPILLAILLAVLAQAAAAQPASQPATQPAEQASERFLRFVDDNEGGGQLQTAIVTYRNDAGATVHLVAAVHVGETAYYHGLSKTFETYDALLYEMVKPKDAAIPRAGVQSDSMVSTFQRVLKDVLELDFQLDAVDYSPRNFVHADLDAETFARMQEERGESMLTLMLRQMLVEMSKPQPPDQQVSLTELLVAFTSPDRARHLKLILAKQFKNVEEKMSAFDGPDGSVLVTERNKAAIRALQTTLAEGKSNVGIFYGAAHMPDLEERILAMGFRPVAIEWRTAWDMTPQEGDVVLIVKRKPATQPANSSN